MKKILALTVMLAGLSSALAQGTFFSADLNGQSEVPPNNSALLGVGNFDLSGGTTFNYGVSFSAPGNEITDVTINGPAGPGSTAPVLFDLGAAVPTINPPPGFPSGVSGTINNLTSPEIDDLLAGLWYVNVFTSSGSYPDGEIRGQIVPVPEPSSLVLLGGCAAALLWWTRKRIP